jgi:hypothetical protein
VYWLREPVLVISEIGRILRRRGKVCLMLPNKTFPEYSFYNQLYVKTGNPKWAFLEKLDRGRFSNNIKHSRSDKEWEQMFTKAKLKIVSHQQHLSKTTIQLWDIGLRPLFPLLKKITDTIAPNDFLSVKEEWIDTIRIFLEPLLELDTDSKINSDQEPAFHCYILEK